MRIHFAPAVVVMVALPAHAAVESYQGAERALATLNAAPSAKAANAATSLLADLQRFEKDPPKDGKRAAEEFAALVDRTLDLPRLEVVAFAQESGEHLTLQTAMRALPPPHSWPHLQRLWSARALAKDHTLRSEALALLGLLLVGNRDGARAASADVIERVSRTAAGERGGTSWLESEIERAFDDGASDPLAHIERLTKKQTREWDGPQAIPDLVALYGEDKARQQLKRLLAVPGLEIETPRHSATERLARELVTEQLATLPSPHWEQVRGAPPALFEAMEKRFLNPAAAIGPTAATTGSADGARGMSGSSKADANVQYVIALLRAGRGPDAQRALHQMVRLEAIDPKTIMREAISADVVTALAEALEAMLAERSAPGLAALRREAALRAGHGERALATLKRQLDKASAADRPALISDVTALQLALGRVDDAIALLKRSVARGAADDAAHNQLRAAHALSLARVGAAQRRADLLEEAASAYERLCAADASFSSAACSELQPVLTDAFLDMGRGPRAERLLFGQLRAKSSVPDYLVFALMPTVRSLVEVYARAGRHDDVLRLITEYPGWGAPDLALLVHGGGYDRGGAHRPPLVVRAAEALVSTSRTQEARDLLREYLTFTSESEHLDKAYGLLARIDGSAMLPWLETRIAADPFEERPLIWKAQLLGEAGDAKGAEEAARRAIAIDPSDGEQKRGDRLRAYSVLAEALTRQGRLEEAKTIETAIGAIRASEDADRLREAGLTSAAIAAYEKASRQFADAYCIHSRAAIELEAAGKLAEAQAHYERAFELMPSSFGRVETHCFGCEGVFDSVSARTSAERVLGRFVKERPRDARAHYLLGSLFKVQHRSSEAAVMFRKAFELDPDYLNAYRRFLEVADEAFVDPAARETAALAMVRIDPRARRHGCRELRVRRLDELYRTLAAAGRADTPRTQLFALPASAKELEKQNGGRRMPSFRPEGCQTPGDAVAQQQSVLALLSIVSVVDQR